MENSWSLHCPAPECGRTADGIYPMGPVLMDEEYENTPQDAFMQIVSGVCEADFQDYVRKLKEAGLRPVFENRQADDLFFGCTDGKACFQISFRARTGEIRVCEDPLVTPADQFCCQNTGETEPRIYQYGLYYDPDNNVTDRTVNCGMLYIIRLSDNSLVMIDGGHLFQWNNEALEGLWQFLHEITGTAPDGEIRIACWYFTHAHSDHTHGCSCLLYRYHEKIRLERVMLGFLSYQHLQGGYDMECHGTKRMILLDYPEVMQLRVHTGMKLQLSDVSFEFLFAQEDAVTAENPSQYPLHDFNCTSSVMKVTLGGRTVLFLGDTNVESERVITKISEPSLWRADMVQAAHHCFNYLDTLYSWIAAPQALMPNSYDGSHQPENLPKLAGLEKYLKDNRIYYEGTETAGFAAGEDGFEKVYAKPLTGGKYDGTFGWLGNNCNR